MGIKKHKEKNNGEKKNMSSSKAASDKSSQADDDVGSEDEQIKADEFASAKNKLKSERLEQRIFVVPEQIVSWKWLEMVIGDGDFSNDLKIFLVCLKMSLFFKNSWKGKKKTIRKINLAYWISSINLI